MTYFYMRGEDRFRIGDVISVTEPKRLSLRRYLKEMWRLRSLKAGRYEWVTTSYEVTAINTGGAAETLQLPEGWEDYL
jgi:hypothetical protein